MIALQSTSSIPAPLWFQNLFNKWAQLHPHLWSHLPYAYFSTWVGSGGLTSVALDFHNSDNLRQWRLALDPTGDAALGSPWSGLTQPSPTTLAQIRRRLQRAVPVIETVLAIHEQLQHLIAPLEAHLRHSQALLSTLKGPFSLHAPALKIFSWLANSNAWNETGNAPRLQGPTLSLSWVDTWHNHASSKPPQHSPDLLQLCNAEQPPKIVVYNSSPTRESPPLLSTLHNGRPYYATDLMAALALDIQHLHHWTTLDLQC